MTNNRAFKARFVSLVLIIVLVLGLSSRYPLGALATVTGAAPIDLGVTYNFANFNAASAYGTVKLVTNEKASYDLYWGDGEGNKLKYDNIEFTEFGTITTDEVNNNSEYQGSYRITSPYLVIPEGAKEVLVYKEETKTPYKCDIPESKQFNEGKVSYSFGLMSDVHFNRYNDYSQDDSVPAFNNALKFINDRNIDFVGMTGDLSNQGEDNSYKKFNNAINKYPGMTVYTCMGNHDVSWTGSQEAHVKSFAKQVNTKRTSDKNIRTISSNGVDFVYEKNGDIFIFFSQTRGFYRKNISIVSEQQLNWLEKNLNTYANKNVYLFFHTYFADEKGDATKAVGNLKNPGGYTYDLTYIFGNSDEVRFRKLLNKYPNVTMFSGHSHWAYDQQKYNSNLNIGNINKKATGASLVHIASVSAPRTIEENSTTREENNGLKSQGTIALKYSESTVYLGVDFKEGKYLAYASYLNKDGKKSTPKPALKIAKAKISSVSKAKKLSKKSKKYKVSIRYRKVDNATKYQVQYSTNNKFKKAKTKTVKTNRYTIKGLKKNTRYYIRVRAVGYQFGYKITGSWSATKKVKTGK